ncbi:MAG: DUF6596 domain-containing protein [Gemmataceae bacterium]
MAARLDSVHHALYLLFSEGYCSSDGESAIRGDLCEGGPALPSAVYAAALRGTPAGRAAMALMLFHAARLDARLDQRGLSC